MTKRVLGHGATCCGKCELCTPTKKKSEKAKPKDDFRAETVLFEAVEEDQ